MIYAVVILPTFVTFALGLWTGIGLVAYGVIHPHRWRRGS
jgi:hypothetical protein